MDFDALPPTAYEDFVRTEQDFYRLVEEHLNTFVPDNALALAIGAGPGTEARLLDALEKRTILHGLEPSHLHEAGCATRDYLREKGSGVTYTPWKVGIEDIDSIGLLSESVDLILLLKAAHEIALSVGGKEAFKNHLERATVYLKKNGVLIIGDVQYARRIREDPQAHASLVQTIRTIDEQRIHHSHPPHEFIDEDEIPLLVPSHWRSVRRHDVVPHTFMDNALRQKGITPDYSPREFYVITFQNTGVAE